MNRITLDKIIKSELSEEDKKIIANIASYGKTETQMAIFYFCINRCGNGQIPEGCKLMEQAGKCFLYKED